MSTQFRNAPFSPIDPRPEYPLFDGRPGVRALGTITNGAKATIGIPGAQRPPMHPKAPERDYSKVHAEVQLWWPPGCSTSRMAAHMRIVKR